MKVSTFRERVAAPERGVPEGVSEEKGSERKTLEMEIKKTKVEFEIRGHSKGI
jgi:hypothetical protein